MNRRSFLSFLGAATAVALDPERALWVPGAKLISVPAPRIWMYRLEFITRLEFETRFPENPTKIGSTLHIRRPQRFLVRG